MTIGKKEHKHEQIRDLLNRQAKALSDEAVRAGGQVPHDKLESLENLQRLAEIYSSSTPPSRRLRWPVAVLLGATLAIVSILLFARVKTTEIELSLSLSELEFRLPKEQVFANTIRLSSLGVSGLAQIQLPRTGEQEARTLLASDGSGSSIQLTNGPDSMSNGSITLSAMTLAAGTHIWLHPTEIPRQFRLSVKGAPQLLTAGVNGLIGIGLPGTPASQLNFTSPKSILLQSGPGLMDLDLGFAHAAKNTFARQLIADSLSLFHVDEHFEQDLSIVRRISTILSGTIYLESLGGEERPLRPGEEISFASAQGEVRTLELQDDHITVNFHGRVAGMSSGMEDHIYSIMPTYLDWLKARHGLTLLWGTTLYFFGLIVSVYRWWKASN